MSSLTILLIIISDFVFFFWCRGSIKLAEYANKVEKDTRATCSAFGEVASVKVAVPRVVSPQPVFVEFRSGIHAAAAAENLASRTYDGRQLVVRRLTRQELLSEIEDFYLRSQSTTAPPQPPIPLKSNGSARHFQFTPASNNCILH